MMMSPIVQSPSAVDSKLCSLQGEQACKAEEPLSAVALSGGTALAKADTADDKAGAGWLPPLPDEARPSSACADRELGGVAASGWLPPLPDEAPASSPAAAAEGEAAPWPRPLPELDRAPLAPPLPPGVGLEEGANPQTAVLPPGIGIPEPVHAAAGTEPEQAPPLLPVDAEMLLPPHLRHLNEGPSAVKGKLAVQPLHPTDGAPLPPGQGFSGQPWPAGAREEPQHESSSARAPPQGLTDCRASTPSPERVPMSLGEGDRTPVWTGSAQQDQQLPAAHTEGPTGAPVPVKELERIPSYAEAAWPDARLPAAAGIPQPPLLPGLPGFPENAYEGEPQGQPTLSLRHFLREPPQLSLSGRGPPHGGDLPGPPSLELRHFLPDNVGAAPQPWQSSAAQFSAPGGLQQPAKQPAAHHVQHVAATVSASLQTASQSGPGIAFACRAPSGIAQSKQARLPAFSLSSQDSAAEQTLPDEATQQEVQHLRTQQTAKPCDRQEVIRPSVNENSGQPPCTEKKNVEAQLRNDLAGVRPLADECAGRPASSALGNSLTQPQKPAADAKRSRENEPVRRRFETGCRTVSRAPQAGSPVVRKFPSRPGQKACDFFMRTGWCKFGMDCKFDHPNLGLKTPEAGRGTGPEPSPVLPSSNVRKDVSGADVRNSAAMQPHSAGGTPHSSERAARAREPAPLNTARRAGSRPNSPRAERRSSERTPAGLRIEAPERRHPHSRDSAPLHRGRRSGSRDDVPLAERWRMQRVASRLKGDAPKGQEPGSRDPTPLRREHRPGPRGGSPRAERRSTERVPARLSADARSSLDPRSSERVPSRLEAAACKDRAREDRLHQQHEARRAGRPMQPSSSRSRERSQSRNEPSKPASNGSGLKRGISPQKGGHLETGRDQPDGVDTSDTASGKTWQPTRQQQTLL